MNQHLIYDVGLHNGEDTDFYLRKGFQVVAIEAHPNHVANAKIRFQDAIARGRLHIIEGAVAPASAGDKVVFYESLVKSDWGTVKVDYATRGQMLGSPTERIEVKRVDMVDVFRSHGIPFYLKIDVEGADRLVLEQLATLPDRPQYVSMESETVDFDQLRAEMDLLKSLGYRKFNVVQQGNLPGMEIRTLTLDGRPFEHVFGHHTSGPFGDDLPGPWLTYDEAIQEYKAVFRRYKYFGDYSLVPKIPGAAQKVVRKLYRTITGYEGALPGWFDTHASL